MESRSSRLTPLSLALALAVALAASATLADETNSKTEMIALAMRAAPPGVSSAATIVDMDGAVLRPGTNGWTCMPGIAHGDHHPMCNDEVWTSLMKAVGTKAAFHTDRIGISYMLAGDAHVNNADPFDTHPDPGEVWVQEGPHLMIVVPSRAMLEGISDDPESGGPYVMWKDTPYAHIMVPTGPRTE
jgi:hypothetical protein